MNEQIIALITDFVLEYQASASVESTWRKPVVGFASADDEKFARLKTIIGPNHALPQDIVAGAKSVIVYFMPFGEEIVKGNVGEEESSRGWDIANIETNALIVALNQKLHDFIEAQGYHASLLPPTYNYDGEKLISDWSHKSAAYIAGIGKFGLHQLLITEAGCCGRFGSVITDMPLEPTPFREEEYCLYFAKGKCKACVKKCPNQALSVDGKEWHYDRYRCNSQIYDKIVPVYANGNGDACGKCMCGVACSCRAPGK